MIELAPLFRNFFADRQHSFLELSRYANRHLILLTANNPGNALDDVITEVTTAFTAFAGCLGDEEALAAAREAANQARNNLKRSMRGANGAVSRAAAAVQAAFGKPSPDYTACFAFGVEGITGASNVQMEERLENLRAALAARSAQVGAAHVTAITNLKTSWVALNAAAGAALGAESTQEDLRAACREDLTRALSRSALWLAWHFNGQPEKFDLYCPVHLLRNAQEQPPGTCTITVTGGVGQWTGTAEASGADLVRWFSRAAGSSDAFADVGNGTPGEELTFDLVPAGSYEVKARGENGAGEGAESEVAVVEVT